MRVSIYLTIALNLFFYFVGFFVSANIFTDTSKAMEKIAREANEISEKATNLSYRYRDEAAILSNKLVKLNKSFKNCLVENARLRKPNIRDTYEIER